MKQEKVFSWTASIALCVLLLAAGCAPTAKEAVKLEVGLEKQIPEPETAKTAVIALKFTPQDSTTYKLTTQVKRSVEFEDPSSDKDTPEGGHNENTIEMTFTQQIQSINDKGNAIARITFKKLKYLTIVKDHTVLDFDSSREKDQNNSLAKLIGQGYTIEITPAGKVTKVTRLEHAIAAVKTGPQPGRTIVLLLSPESIKERHGFIVLPATGKNRLSTGDNWNSLKSFSFGMMGSKSYEKIHTLKQIKETDDNQIAIVEINVIPSSELAEQLYAEQTATNFSKIFDNTETYTGQLRFDLTSGKVEKYLEKLQSVWIAVDTFAEKEDDKEPATLRMSATRLYRLEKID